MTVEYQYLVRIVGNDIPGERKMVVGLTQIRGVGYMFANTILNLLKINPDQRIGYLSSEQVKSIESIIKNPSASNFPSWFLNRRKDVETGEDKHLITSDIAFTVRNDVEREKTSGSWRGIRHMFGLKVRGQRTRCTGRKGGAVGVAKGGKIMPARAGEAVEGEPTAGAEGTEPATEAKEGSEKKEAPATGKKEAPATGKKETPPADKKK
ncbi:30S ribosomal protein S13 [Marine Group I thaumarchaeote]|uniref:Small ribosomal subunit protein uS13 n=1 Tax=Marine Group I thaumarchaeote TaxID=2511932 RepID=A0A7K4MY71_9ARCH|nr:30S ribosomal protein S13 [Marine Group I thaumarchaeote]